MVHRGVLGKVEVVSRVVNPVAELLVAAGLEAVVEEADAIDRFCERGGTVAAVEFDGWRVNVNTPEDLAEATRMLEE